jgi:hypothetical protein
MMSMYLRRYLFIMHEFDGSNIAAFLQGQRPALSQWKQYCRLYDRRFKKYTAISSMVELLTIFLFPSLRLC